MSQNGYANYIQNKIIKRLENQKNTKNLIHLINKKLLQFLEDYPMQEYMEKNALKIWSENLNDT